MLVHLVHRNETKKNSSYTTYVKEETILNENFSLQV